MGTTTRGYRYPDPTVNPDGPLAFQQLAEDVNGDVQTRVDRRPTITAGGVPVALAAVTATSLQQTAVLPAATYARVVQAQAQAVVNYSQSARILVELVIGTTTAAGGTVLASCEKAVVGGVAEPFALNGRAVAVAASAAAAARTITVRITRATGTGAFTTTADTDDNTLSAIAVEA